MDLLKGPGFIQPHDLWNVIWLEGRVRGVSIPLGGHHVYNSFGPLVINHVVAI